MSFGCINPATAMQPQTSVLSALDSKVSAGNAADSELSNFIASNLRLLRKRAGWSQQRLAEHVGLNRGNIASYEAATAEPKICNLLRISNLFGVSTHDLTRRDFSMPDQLDAAMEAYQSEELASKSRVATAIQRLDELEEVSQSISKLHRYQIKTLAQEAAESRDKLEPLELYFEQMAELQQRISREYRELLDRLKCHC